MDDLRQLQQNVPTYPKLLFFYQGDVEQGRDFFHSFWPEARAVSDVKMVFYKEFGLRRGKLSQMFSPSTLVCGWRASKKGHRIGKPMGDPLMMPGMFFVHDSKILWHHDFSHAGDHPELPRLGTLLPSLLPTAT